jgi:hypothetical protein
VSESVRVKEFLWWVENTGFNVRAFQVIHDVTGLDYVDIPAFLANCWKAWAAHRDYEVGPYTSPYSPHVVGVFEHDVEKDGPGDEPESYIISPLMDVIASIPWGEKSLGPFKEILPIWSDCPVDPEMILVWSHSWKGAGGAARCRWKLKELLPKEFHRWISKTRTANSSPKHKLLGKALATYEHWDHRQFDEAMTSRAYPEDYDGPHRNWSLFSAMKTDRNLQPDSYRKRTKAQLWIELVLLAEVPEIVGWIDPEDFWRAATGRVKPNEVEGLMRRRQPELFDAGVFDALPRKKRAPRQTSRRLPGATQLTLLEEM